MVANAGISDLICVRRHYEADYRGVLRGKRRHLGVSHDLLQQEEPGVRGVQGEGRPHRVHQINHVGQCQVSVSLTYFDG